MRIRDPTEQRGDAQKGRQPRRQAARAAARCPLPFLAPPELSSLFQRVSHVALQQPPMCIPFIFVCGEEERVKSLGQALYCANCGTKVTTVMPVENAHTDQISPAVEKASAPCAAPRRRVLLAAASAALANARSALESTSMPPPC